LKCWAAVRRGDGFVEAPPRLGGRDIREGAQKFVAADAHDQVVGAHPARESAGHIAKQVIAGAVAVLVVDGLEVVHVDERHHKTSVRPPRALDFALQLLETDTAPTGTGELVDPGQLAVARGLRAVAPRLLAVVGGLLAVARGELTITRRAHALVRGALLAHGHAAAKLLNTQRVPGKQPLARIEHHRLLVADGGVVVALRRELVALLGRLVALAGESSPCRGLAGASGRGTAATGWTW
jgi:hypothetical protein